MLTDRLFLKGKEDIVEHMRKEVQVSSQTSVNSKQPGNFEQPTSVCSELLYNEFKTCEDSSVFYG